MTDGHRPPIVHLVLLALLALAFLIGGRIRFEAWGEASVRALAGYGTVAVLLHLASRFTADHGLAVRSLAWLTVLAAPLHLDALLRVEVLVPVAALGLVDLAQHRAGLSLETDVEASSRGKAVAGVATVGLLAILAVLVPLAKSTAILLRLGVVATVGWGLLSLFALRPAVRSPWRLLGAAGAFAATFALLAGPVVPLGPLVTYWVAILAVAAAVLTATFSRTGAAVRDEHRLHEQTVRNLPDPVVAPLADRVHDVLVGAGDREAFSRRVEAAVGEPREGQLLDERTRELREEGLGRHRARRRALADVLDVDLDEADGGTT